MNVDRSEVKESARGVLIEGAPRMTRREWLGRNLLGLGAVVATGGGLSLYAPHARAAIDAVRIPAPAVSAKDPSAGVTGKAQHIVLAGGCFWGVQLVYQHTRGVIEALSGYSGGTKETANYEDSSTGNTGHAQSVQVTFDPAKISLAELLHIYFSVAHNPTTVNRQHMDIGPQYRSAIFTDDAEQKAFARQYIAQLEAAKVFPDPIVTQLNPLGTFFTAEAYHQDYAILHPDEPYIVKVDMPMLVNLKAIFPEYYLKEPVLVYPGSKTASR